MKSVRYFTLNFSGFTTAACENRGICVLSPATMSFIPINAILTTLAFDRLTINQPLHPGARSYCSR
nr:Uncharacterised protein [Klebsiella pneumoniae]